MPDTTVTLLTPTVDEECGASAISWPSILGGALAIAATTVIFVSLGGALGMAHPDTEHGMMEMGAAAAIWLVVTQWIASGIGGYLTGRLRTKWAGVHTHEVFFRDTAHGFLAWALAAVVGAAIMGTVLVSGLDHMHGHHPSPMMQGQEGPAAYYIDSLYRPTHVGPESQMGGAPETAMTPPAESVPVSGTEPSTPGNSVMAPVAPPAPPARVSPELRAETSRILMRAMGPQGLPDADKTYLAQLVSSRTGLSSDDAAKRVDDVTARMQNDAKTAHKAIGYFSLFTGLSMLIGAFIAAAAAALGGTQRDEWEEAVRTGTYKG